MQERSQDGPPLDTETLQAFTALLFPRPDIHARQRDNGDGYILYSQPVTVNLVERHLRGDVTLGTYCLSEESTAHFVAIDADDGLRWAQLMALARTLPTPVYLEQSKRGGHLWQFFEEPISGALARRYARGLLKKTGLEPIEIYPRQAHRAAGVGSLIRVPFGFHRKLRTPYSPGKRFGFLAATGELLAPTIRQQLALLAYVERVPQAFVEEIAQRVAAEPLPPTPTKPFQPRPTDKKLPLSERLIGSISVFDFVSRYIDLDEQGRGLCPFHEDTQMSFGVNRARNYWHCFAECAVNTGRGASRGGNIIHFWMLWRHKHGQDASFRATIADLARLIGL